MGDYLWIYILAGICLVSCLFFILTLNKDLLLLKRLRKQRRLLLLNFSLIAISLSSLGLIIYLFVILKDQINLLG